MPKFKIGDRVNIKSELLDYWSSVWNTPIEKKIFTIKNINKDGLYEVKENEWFWGEKLFEYADFCRDDIREFDIVELESGYIGIVQKKINGDLCLSGIRINMWKENMRGCYEEHNIIRVYRPVDSIPTTKDEWKKLPIIWERASNVKFKTKAREMTIKEISEILGYDIKIVKGE